MAASRMALARALIEYDNDSDDDDTQHATRKDWRQSAIFIPYHKAQQEARRQKILSQPAPVLPSPLEATFTGDKTPTAAAPLPLPAPQQAGDEQDIADVRDWGLPSHLVSAKSDLPPRQRVVSQLVPHPVPPHIRAQSQYASEHFHDDPQRTTHGDRRVSLDQYSTGQDLERRERSGTLVGRPYSAMGLQDSMRPEVRDRRISDPVMIPLPSSPSPATALLPPPSLSLGFDTGLGEEEEVIEDGRPNPFAVAAPRPEMGSRFDPKVLQEQRRSSIDSTRSIVAPRPLSLALTLDGNQPPSSDHLRQSSDLSSRRSTDLPHLSRPSLDSYHSSPILDFPHGEEYDEIPTPEAFGRPLMPSRYAPSAVTRMNRTSLRPTILVMPSPLADAPSVGYEPKTRDGFVLGEKPLPADAKTQGRRPGIPLSLSQRTFRSSLMIDGRREDPEWIGGAEEDGEIGVERRDTSEAFVEKKAGKLYGRSLMDELEARKNNMKGRSRTFMGDSRPAMMSRSSMHIDSGSLSPTSPSSSTSKRPGSFRPGGRQPLLRMNSNENIYALEAPDMNSRENKSQSVFGVDYIWEREMVKLRQLQEQEARLQKANQEEKRRKEEAEGKKKKKRKSRAKSKLSEEWSRENWEKVDDPARQEPPVEPLQETASFRESIKERDDKSYIAEGSVAGSPTPEEPVVEEDSDSDDSEANVPLSKLANKSASLRSPSVQNASGSASIIQSSASASVVEDDDSDEDVPLSRLVHHSPSVSSSSQLRPLTTTEPLRLPFGSPTPSKSYSEEYGAEEDDLPLAIRQAQSKGLKPPTRAEVVEDDLPLGYKHADVVQRQMQKRNFSGLSGMSGMGGPGSTFGAPQMGMGSPYNSMWGMPQMPMGQMPLGMPYGQPMGYGMGMGMPPMGMMGQMGQMSMPNLAGPGMMGGEGHEGPAANIDSWRHEVPLGVGSARSGEGSV
ncbi:hypothetical protein L202_08385 [Cryptococcus amylolentus CBS 6039]|uniref:Uncharacterized protein n=1 Tax=Cryptococcus amylolentus CBS 6039 TaxID=1295533 RepID=A0A1E3H9H2_9TREE|nr:hypothetical protein L202_08385 [Cryptococcus amylolentus CBS 6039]ODN72987.1 hypothetical protein L202_08385 [Cryptococcus amylolentus CBS 6039]